MCERGVRSPVTRWVHSGSALVGVGGRLVGAGAVQLGGALRLAAYVFQREAVKARRVQGGGGGGHAAAAAGGSAACASVPL